jgi:2-methylaconitate cis-trans-isomerase PrpF
VTVASHRAAVRCVIMRGGTSKGLHFHADDLPPAGDILRIGHSLGVMDVVVAFGTETDCRETRFAKLGFAGTAGRLIDGLAYVPREPE